MIFKKNLFWNNFRVIEKLQIQSKEFLYLPQPHFICSGLGFCSKGSALSLCPHLCVQSPLHRVGETANPPPPGPCTPVEPQWAAASSRGCWRLFLWWLSRERRV